MSAPPVGPCGPWIDEDDVTACCAGLADPPDSELLAKAITVATNLLFRWSGRQFPGECELTVRPCSGDGCGCGACGVDSGWSWWWWDQRSTSWSRWDPSLCEPFPGCGCRSGVCDPPSVTLPAPVTDVTEVVIDGVVLDPSAYAVVDYRRLVRLDGEHWPTSNNLSLNSAPGGDTGTWQITFTYGRGPGVDGQIAAAAFACQIAKLLCNAEDPTCVLPDHVRGIVREGVTFELDDLMRLMENSRTGVRLTDMWLDSVNPARLARRSRFTRLGAPRRNYRTFT